MKRFSCSRVLVWFFMDFYLLTISITFLCLFKHYLFRSKVHGMTLLLIWHFIRTFSLWQKYNIFRQERNMKNQWYSSEGRVLSYAMMYTQDNQPLFGSWFLYDRAHIPVLDSAIGSLDVYFVFSSLSLLTKGLWPSIWGSWEQLGSQLSKSLLAMASQKSQAVCWPTCGFAKQVSIPQWLEMCWSGPHLHVQTHSFHL
jgi:hypothetical protein